MPIRDWVFGLFGRRPRRRTTRGIQRGPAVHVVILDGTMSSLARGAETNAGATFKLINEGGRRDNLTVHYEAGIQWRDWSSTLDIVTGRGIDRQIERSYGVLASRWREGDRIVLIGYSRGAYAVRSLGGMIGAMGLLRRREATVRNIETAWRHYRAGAVSPGADAFRDAYCETGVVIEAVAVWDTVKALGVRLPLIWRWSRKHYLFHDHRLGPHVRNGFHALALDETRIAYAPVMWESRESWTGGLEQVWFRGTHGDVGGQLSGHDAARPLANVPLVWMLGRLEACGVALPEGWADRFVQDAGAPSVGAWNGWKWIFWARRRRLIGRDPSERLHESVERAR